MTNGEDRRPEIRIKSLEHEIASLRADCARLKREAEDVSAMLASSSLASDMARLAEEKRGWSSLHETCWQTGAKLLAERDAARVEVERLQSALDRIDAALTMCGAMPDAVALVRLFKAVRNIVSEWQRARPRKETDRADR